MNATATLYMSEGGQLACREHMPYPGSDTFVWDGWAPMPEHERIDFVRQLKREPECETCRAMRTSA